jgi:Zn finger protein HypA/HybF involved in hydrogenase expression
MHPIYGLVESVPVRCAQCGAEATLRIAQSPSQNQPMQALEQTSWNCPHCQQRNVGGFAGKVLFILRGHRAGSRPD